MNPKFLILHMFPNRGKEYNQGRTEIYISAASILYFFETEFRCELENEKPFAYKRTIMKLAGGSMLDIEETAEQILYKIIFSR